MSTKFEKEIISVINSFRENPKSIQHQVEVLRKGLSRLKANDPFLKEIDEFLRTIDRIPKMKKLVLNKSLSQTAKEEVKKFSRDENYSKYRRADELRGVVSENYLKQNASLIADDGADEAETVVPKLLLNKTDRERKGRKILTDPNYTQIGIATCEYDNENYIILLFANEKVADDSDPNLPNCDLSLLKQAFDLYDHDNTQKIKIQECLDGMKSVKFNETNPELYDIINDLKENEICSWPRFAFHVYSKITDRVSDDGLRTLFDLFIDDPKKDTITFDTFKRICQEVGENIPEEEMRNILEITTESGNDISFEDFCNYMRLTEEK